jgi:hypothetical protein
MTEKRNAFILQDTIYLVTYIIIKPVHYNRQKFPELCLNLLLLLLIYLYYLRKKLEKNFAHFIFVNSLLVFKIRMRIFPRSSTFDFSKFACRKVFAIREEQNDSYCFGTKFVVQNDCVDRQQRCLINF